jgi:hypothetical protein
MELIALVVRVDDEERAWLYLRFGSCEGKKVWYAFSILARTKGKPNASFKAKKKRIKRHKKSFCARSGNSKAKKQKWKGEANGECSLCQKKKEKKKNLRCFCCFRWVCSPSKQIYRVSPCFGSQKKKEKETETAEKEGLDGNTNDEGWLS